MLAERLKETTAPAGLVAFAKRFVVVKMEGSDPANFTTQKSPAP